MRQTMKTIEIDEELYQYIAAQTKHIGEDASSILRRLLNINQSPPPVVDKKSQKQSGYTIIANLLSDDSFTEQKSIVNRFILLLKTLYEYNSALFSIAATSLHGSKRKYLAKDKESLELSGKNTKPREIVGTPYWVITNTNTARKIYIIESIMSSMGISENMIHEVTSTFAQSTDNDLNHENQLELSH